MPPTDPMPAWVQAAPFRAHVRHLIDTTGLPWPVVAAEAGAPTALVQRLVSSRRGRTLTRIPPVVARRLLDLSAGDLLSATRRTVPAGATGVRVSALLGAGHEARRVAAFCRLTEAELLALPRAVRCSRLTEILVEAACILSVRTPSALRAAA